ncbi:glucosamine-6-phosphate deaminase [Thalassospira sp.]|uniref:glucosamine-6-phosphate deaminase n=1 Tax=Thalassospira sp. TaxID=1912094 RepID=UPI003AA7BB06
MKIFINKSKQDSGAQAVAIGGDLIVKTIAEHGEARIILATGASQFDMLRALVARTDIDWSKCSVFHLDEYIGLPKDHPASFVGYLIERFVKQIPSLKHFEAINGLADPEQEIARLNHTVGTRPVDVAFIGIGENGHLAFNDPPADLETGQAYLRVQLDEACRSQQVSEGWFPSIDDVPLYAITMSIPQILKTRTIICTVPDARKADAVKGAVEGPVSDMCPASSLQKHSNTYLFLDAPSAEKLGNEYKS